MIVYFLRHADAEPHAGSDFERKLTPKGLEQSEKVGRFCARIGLVPEIVLSSPVVRARQTAEIVARKLGEVELLECSWLACGMRPETCAAELKNFSKFGEVLLVGHEPDFSSAITFFLGCENPGALKVRKASLTVLDLPAPRQNTGELQFSLPVRLM